MIGTNCKLMNGSKGRIFIKYCLVASIILIALLVASCTVIPGGKECNAVVDGFLRAAAAKDVEAAYGLCVEEMTKEDIENLILGEHQYFAGYQDISMKGINVEYGDPYDYAEYSGEAKYSSGPTMWVEAELVKKGDEWRLLSIWITPSE